MEWPKKLYADTGTDSSAFYMCCTKKTKDIYGDGAYEIEYIRADLIKESQNQVHPLVRPIYAKAERLVKNRLVVKCCPYCSKRHYHGDGTPNGNGKIEGDRVADCGGGHYKLSEGD